MLNQRRNEGPATPYTKTLSSPRKRKPVPKDKPTIATRFRRSLQMIAAFALAAALFADPGCQPKNETVVLDEPAVIIKEPAQSTSRTATGGSSSNMTLMNADDTDAKVAVTAPDQETSARKVTVVDTPQSSAQPSTDPATDKLAEPPVVAQPAAATNTMAALVQSDPLAAFKQLHADAVAQAADYTCTFTKQERIGDTINKQQVIEAKFRAEPYSVYFHFVENPGLAGKVIYIKDKWVDEDASDPELRQLAAVRPAGLLGIAGVLKQPIRSDRAKKAGRRFIDQFGFERGLELLVRFSQMAADEGTLTLEYQGQGEFKGRPVWLIKRLLPYTDDNGVYPDRLALIYIDQEWGVPIAIHTFRSDAPIPEELLGKYEYTNVNFDAQLSNADFDPDSI